MVPRKGLTRRRKAHLPIACQRFEIDRVLVAEHRIEARRTHAGRGGNLVKRRAGIAGPPERFRGPLQGRLRIIGGWSSAAHRASAALLPCHISMILVATVYTYICMH